MVCICKIELLCSNISDNSDTKSQFGKGCLKFIFTKLRIYNITSSLKNSFNGSINFKFIFFGNPPTLWCDLILEVLLPLMICSQWYQDIRSVRYFIFLYFWPVFKDFNKWIYNFSFFRISNILIYLKII